MYMGATPFVFNTFAQRQTGVVPPFELKEMAIATHILAAVEVVFFFFCKKKRYLSLPLPLSSCALQLTTAAAIATAANRLTLTPLGPVASIGRSVH